MKNIFYCILFCGAAILTGCQDDSQQAANPALPAQEVDKALCEQYRNDISEVIKNFAGWGKQYGNSIELLDAQGKVQGFMLLPFKEYKRVEGYNGFINTAVVLSPEKKIIAIAIGKNDETPRFMQRIRQAGFMNKWNGLTPQQAETLQVDAVTSATYSSDAITGEVKAACAEFNQNTR